MTKLSDAQRVILAAAAKREDLKIVLPPKLRGGAADKALAALEKRGLIAPSEPNAAGGRADIAGSTGYAATPAGLAAIGIEATSAAVANATVAHPSNEGRNRSKAQRAAADLRGFARHRGAAPAADLDASGTQVRAAGARGDRFLTPRTTDSRHTADATSGAIEAGASTAPVRPGCKLATLTALVTREGGAGIEELTRATGWLPHTVRAALTGLRKRGVSVTRRCGPDGRSIYVAGGG
jgi:hypothetical protein